jgi:hypothetical protein
MFAMQRLVKTLLISWWVSTFWLAAPVTLGFAWQSEPTPTPSQNLPVETPQALVRSPGDGQAVIGTVEIIGNTDLPGFLSAELSFAYQENPTNTWFLISSSTEPVRNGTLAEWDTSTITDGSYDLRLVVSRQDGDDLIYTVKDIRVRNYTPIETNTPTPVTPTATPLPGDTPVPTSTPTPTETPIPPTPTRLPPNPIQVTGGDFANSLVQGVAIIAGAFVVIGIYASIRNLRRPS